MSRLIVQKHEAGHSPTPEVSSITGPSTQTNLDKTGQDKKDLLHLLDMSINEMYF